MCALSDDKDVPILKKRPSRLASISKVVSVASFRALTRYNN